MKCAVYLRIEFRNCAEFLFKKNENIKCIKHTCYSNQGICQCYTKYGPPVNDKLTILNQLVANQLTSQLLTDYFINAHWYLIAFAFIE